VKKDGAVHLNWKTVDEINMKSVVLQSSADGINTENVAELTARNTPQNQYFYKDSSVSMITMYRLQGYRYYRLAFVNQNLSREYSPWINVIDSELSAHPNQYFDVFPNPADHRGLTVLPRLSGIFAGELSLIDKTGRFLTDVFLYPHPC
jgi:hypothetical protein